MLDLISSKIPGETGGTCSPIPIFQQLGGTLFETSLSPILNWMDAVVHKNVVKRMSKRLAALFAVKISTRLKGPFSLLSCHNSRDSDRAKTVRKKGEDLKMMGQRGRAKDMAWGKGESAGRRQ